MKREVRLDVVYPHAPERVWKALTDSDALAKWLMPNDFQPRLGHRFRFLKKDKNRRRSSVIQCEVVELDAPHRLAFTWSSEPDAPPDLVCWTLEAVEAGTRLRLEHIAVDDAMPLRAHAAPRWEMQLPRLSATLERELISARPRGRVVLRGSTYRGIDRRIRRTTHA